LIPVVRAGILCGLASDGVAVLRADVRRFCGELVELPDHQGVAWAELVNDAVQLGAGGHASAAPLALSVNTG
jgi:hypothetical protein